MFKAALTGRAKGLTFIKPRPERRKTKLFVAGSARLFARLSTWGKRAQRAALLNSDEYFFSCCRYIELNPVRAKIVRHPRDYPFSSHRSNALGEADALVTEHPLFRRLGRGTAAQRAAYRQLFRSKLESRFVDALRAATNGGWALGDDRFRNQIEKAAKRRAAPLPKGRRAEGREDKRQLNLL